MMFGSTRFNPPSRFIEEIPENLLEIKDLTYKTPVRTAVSSRYGYTEKPVNFHPKHYETPKLNEPTGAGIVFNIGDSVVHKAFGEGVVLNVTPVGNDNLLEIAFNKAGTKKIMANFAKIEKM